MRTLLVFCLLSQSILRVELDDSEQRFVRLIKRDVTSVSQQSVRLHTKTYQLGDDIVFKPPNLTAIESILAEDVKTRVQPSIRPHTAWSTREIALNETTAGPWREIARYDPGQRHFILQHRFSSGYKIDPSTGQLTLPNDLGLQTEIRMHAQSGIADGDEILHDVYRLVRLRPASMTCTTNVTVSSMESAEISCSVDYEYLNSVSSPPLINLTFYIQDQNSTFTSVDQSDVNSIADTAVNHSSTLWKRSIRHSIRAMDPGERPREYRCIVIPDTWQPEQVLQSKEHICRTMVHVRTENSSTTTISRQKQWDLLDRLIVIFIVLSGLLLIISLLLCLATREIDRRRRHVQIKPDTSRVLDQSLLESKRPLINTNIFTNNNEMQSEMPLITDRSPRHTLSVQPIHRHKPGCPKYIPSSESHLLSNIDSIKKIILPDIPEMADPSDNQPYIHFYIPSTNERLTIQKNASSK